jgi:formylglycine-generating enzyme required for sulfatase activity
MTESKTDARAALHTTARTLVLVPALGALLLFPHFVLAVFFEKLRTGILLVPVGGVWDLPLPDSPGFWTEALASAVLLLRVAVRRRKDPWTVQAPLFSYGLLFGLCAFLEGCGIFVGRSAYRALLSLVGVSFLLTCVAGFAVIAKASNTERRRRIETAAGAPPAAAARSMLHLRAVAFLFVLVPMAVLGLQRGIDEALTLLGDRFPGSAARPEMVRIPGGSFLMGCSPGDTDCGEMGHDPSGPHCKDAECAFQRYQREHGDIHHPDGDHWWLRYDAEEPAHWVTISSFWMDTAPVTQAQYQAVMGKNPSRFKGRNRPVESVEWPDARSYCELVGKRLPTEAEWEYAARGGRTGPRYGKLDDIAWCGPVMGRWGTHSVATKQPNAFGLYDMLGNVRQWCSDWFDHGYYERSPAEDPKGPTDPPFNHRHSIFHVVRGAGCDDPPGHVRVSRRTGWIFSHVGFRCARDVDAALAAPPPPAAAFQFVSIQPGSFFMGSPPDEPARTRGETQHQVTLTKGFLMSATEVTQGQWKSVMGVNPSDFVGCGDNCPVDRVTWFDAVEFCNKLSDREGLTRCYSGSGKSVKWDRSCTGYRLPTEAEWEYAARAGTTTRFNTGDCLAPDQANFLDMPAAGCPKIEKPGLSYPVAVASYPPNSWGLYDMHGNVAEWVWDWRADYPSGPAVDPTAAATGDYKVWRGGSAKTVADSCRSASRSYGISPDAQDSAIGLRIVRTLP